MPASPYYTMPVRSQGQHSQPAINPASPLSLQPWTDPGYRILCESLNFGHCSEAEVGSGAELVKRMELALREVELFLEAESESEMEAEFRSEEAEDRKSVV